MLRVQIADTPLCSETGGIRGFQSRDPSVNRTAVIKDRNSTPGRGSYCVTFRIQGPRGRERRRSDEATLVPDEWRCAVPGEPARSGNGPRHQELVAGHIWITVENARTPARYWASTQSRLEGVAKRSCASRSEQKPS